MSDLPPSALPPLPDLPLAAGADQPYICSNCQAPSRGAACMNCGQKRYREENLSLRHVLRLAFREMLTMDGRWWGTMRRLFFQPGQLTLDFLEGRRLRNIHPVQLYLFCLMIMIFSAGRSLTSLDSLIRKDATGKFKAMMDGQAKKAGQEPGVFIFERNERLQTLYKGGLIAGDLLLVGPLFFLLFRRRWPYLLQHIVMAVHYTSFSCLLGAALGFFSYLHAGDAILFIAGVIPGGLYLYMAARRVYGQPRGITAAKVGFIWVASAVNSMLVFTVALLVSVLT